MNNVYYQRPNRSSDRQNQKKSDHYYDRYQNIPVTEAMEDVAADSLYMSQQEQEEQYFNPSYKEPVYGTHDISVKKNSKVKELVSNAALIVLSIAVVIGFVALMIEASNMDYDYTAKESGFWYSFENEQYVYAIRDMENNIQSGVPVNREYEQIYAVLDYFKAASFYRVAEYQNDAEKMKEYTDIMSVSLEKMADVSYLADDINRKLGIE